MEGLQGLDKLVRTIGRLKDQSAKRAAIAGLNAGVKELGRAIKTAVNASSASPELKRAARAAVGTRVLKNTESRAVIAAKGGFGVGLHRKRKRATAAAKRAKRAAAGKTTHGVGIDVSDIHWPVLGTSERQTGSKTTQQFRGGQRWHYTKATGNPVHKTGKMPDILHGVMAAAAASAGPAIMERVREGVQKEIAREVHASQCPNLLKH